MTCESVLWSQLKDEPSEEPITGRDFRQKTIEKMEEHQIGKQYQRDNHCPITKR
jgi:hypothetical protein